MMMMSSMRLMAVVIVIFVVGIGMLNGLVFGLWEKRCKELQVEEFVKKNVINGKFENGDMSVDDVINDFRLLQNDKDI